MEYAKKSVMCLKTRWIIAKCHHYGSDNNSNVITYYLQYTLNHLRKIYIREHYIYVNNDVNDTNELTEKYILYDAGVPFVLI